MLEFTSVFTNDLLNISVENIEVSAEDLSTNIKAAWKRFLAMWDKFISWFKKAINSVIDKFKSDTTANVEVSPSYSILRSIHASCTQMLLDKTTTADADRIRRFAKEINKSEQLDNSKKIKQWIDMAKKVIDLLSQVIEMCKKQYSLNRNNLPSCVKEDLTKRIGERRKFVNQRMNERNVDKDFADNNYYMHNFIIEERYLLLVAPRLITKIRTTLTNIIGQ